MDDKCRSREFDPRREHFYIFCDIFATQDIPAFTPVKVHNVLARMVEIRLRYGLLSYCVCLGRPYVITCYVGM